MSAFAKMYPVALVLSVSSGCSCGLPTTRATSRILSSSRQSFYPIGCPGTTRSRVDRIVPPTLCSGTENDFPACGQEAVRQASDQHPRDGATGADPTWIRPSMIDPSVRLRLAVA